GPRMGGTENGGRRSRRAAGALEAAVLRALRTSDAPMTPLEIQAAVDGDLAYNTVYTILTRLRQKGDVIRVDEDSRGTYAPAQTAAMDAVERMRAALGSRGQDEEILQRFVTALSPEQEAILRASLDRDRPDR